jgi:hypothetical protein
MVTPTLVRYIDKARKAMDVQQASVIFRAAELAYTSGDDEAYEGYSVCVDKYNFNQYGGHCSATQDGYLNTYNKATSAELSRGCYNMRPIAWCRGRKFAGSHSTYENVLMKSTLDSGANGNKQRKYTDELLWALCHEKAKGEYDHAGLRSYDGIDGEGATLFIKFKYLKKVSLKRISSEENLPECWIVYRRDDNALPEVWMGYKQGSIKPLRRLYPDPATDYR